MPPFVIPLGLNPFSGSVATAHHVGQRLHRDASSADTCRTTAQRAAEGPRLIDRARAQHYIDKTLSTPVPEHGRFPFEVLHAGQLDFGNFAKTMEAISTQLRASLPRTRSTAALLDAVDKIPERLNAGVQHWYVRHREESLRRIPLDQFNLLLVDELRNAFKAAERLAHNRHASTEQREVASHLAPLLQALKRLHYAANASAMVKAAGARALPELSESSPVPLPGFECGLGAGLAARGGIGAHGDGYKLDLTLKVGPGFARSTTVFNDGDIFRTDKKAVTVGLEGRATAGLGHGGKLFSSTAKLAIEVAGADQWKASNVEQMHLLYGGREKYDNRAGASAGPLQRKLTSLVARAGNLVTDFGVHRGKVFDPLKPTHYSADKAAKGHGAQLMMAEHARALDAMQGPPATAGGRTFEKLVRHAYPSLADIVSTMPEPSEWTQQDLRHLQGLDRTTYVRGPRNASGRIMPTKHAQHAFKAVPKLELTINPTQRFANDDVSDVIDEDGADDGSEALRLTAAQGRATDESEAAGGGAPESSGPTPRTFALPTITATLDLPALADRSTQPVQQLVEQTDFFNPGLSGDFGAALSLLDRVAKRYAAAWPGGDVHPHLKMMEQFSALRRVSLTLMNLPEDGASARRQAIPAIYGDARQMPKRFKDTWLAMQRGDLNPCTALAAVDAGVAMYAREDTRFKLDAERAWAFRDKPEGTRLLRIMNDRWFDGHVPLPNKPKPADFTDFFSRCSDANMLALSGLVGERAFVLHAGSKALGAAPAARQQQFQALADKGAAQLQTRLAVARQHVLPLDKERDLRSSTVVSSAELDKKATEISAGVEVDLGIFGAMFDASRFDVDREDGHIGASISSKREVQLWAIHPALRGVHVEHAVELQGGFVAATIFGSAKSAVLGASLSKRLANASSDDIGRFIGKTPMDMAFGKRTGTLQMRFRLAPDERDQPEGVETARVLQYCRVVTEKEIGPAGSSPNALSALPPGVLKFSYELKAHGARTIHQENGPCPAYNMLEYNRCMRKLMVDDATGQPYPFSRIAANMAADPASLVRIFSRFNPIAETSMLYADAAKNRYGSRTEFHRMLYGKQNEHLRRHGRETMRYAPDRPGKLFDQPPAGEWFGDLAEDARGWTPLAPDLLADLARRKPKARAAWFLATAQGQQQVLRYIRIMEASTSFYNVAKSHGDGYTTHMADDLIDSRRMKQPTGFEPSRSSRFFSDLKDALPSTRLVAADTRNPALATTSMRFLKTRAPRPVNSTRL